MEKQKLSSWDKMIVAIIILLIGSFTVWFVYSLRNTEKKMTERRQLVAVGNAAMIQRIKEAKARTVICGNKAYEVLAGENTSYEYVLIINGQAYISSFETRWDKDLYENEGVINMNDLLKSSGGIETLLSLNDRECP